MTLRRLLDPYSGFQHRAVRRMQPGCTDKFICAIQPNYQVQFRSGLHLRKPSLPYSLKLPLRSWRVPMAALASSNDSAASAALNARSAKPADVIKI
jgi:hypothetical protein